MQINIPITYIQSADSISLRTQLTRRSTYLQNQLKLINPKNRSQRAKALWDIRRIENLIKKLDSIYRLDYNSVIRNTTPIKEAWKKFPKRSSDHADQIFETNIKRKANYKRRFAEFDRLLKLNNDKEIRKKYNQLRIEKAILEDVAKQNYANRKTDLESRLTYECELRVKQGWYIIFNTLTVDTQHYNSVFEVGSKKWGDYVRRFDREIATASYGSVRKAIGLEYHSYFAVIERGTNTGRLHIHVLHFCKKLPSGAYDPNKNCGQPIRREIDVIKKYWKWGTSTPIAVRMSPNDSYGQLQWRWPKSRQEDGSYIGLPIKSPGATVGYVAKYLDKPINGKKKEITPWRVRISRKLGIIPVEKLLKQLSLKQLRMLVTSPLINSIKILGKRIPKTTTKMMASQEYLHRMKNSKRCQNIYHILKDIRPASNLCEQLRSQMMMNSYHQDRKSIINIHRLVTRDTVVYNKIQKLADKICIEVYGQLKPINYLNVLGG